MEYEDVILWDTPEYYYTPKTADWYWILGIIALALAIICILFNNFLLAIFLVIAAFTVGIYAHRRPDIVHHELTPRGLLVGDTMYPYLSLDSYWIEEQQHNPLLIFKSKKVFMPYIIVPIEGVSFADLHEYLAYHLPQVEHHEPLAYKLFEYFGF